MKMPYHKARDSKLDPFHNLDKGNIEKKDDRYILSILHSGVYTVCKIMASDASQKS